MKAAYTLKGKGTIAWRHGGKLHIVKPGQEFSKAELGKIPAAFHGKFEKQEKEAIVPEPDEKPPVSSMDMKADEAIAFIHESEPDSLKGFLSDHEERKTVIQAWDKKFEVEKDDDGKESGS